MLTTDCETTISWLTLIIKGVRAYMQQSRIFVGMVLILIFGEVLGLYGYDAFFVYHAVLMTAFTDLNAD